MVNGGYLKKAGVIFLSVIYGVIAGVVTLAVCLIMLPDLSNPTQQLINEYNAFLEKIPFIGFGVGFAVALIVFLYYEFKRKKCLPIQYYETCVQSDIVSLATAVERERALLIAKNNPEFQQLVSKYEFFFEKGKLQCEGIAKTQENSQLAAEMEKGKQDALSARLQLEKYAEHIGRDKRIRMLDDEKHANIEAAKAYRKGGNDAFSIGQQKELSWGLTGGIASGIAGPAAGLVAASHTQAKNVQIRQQNEKSKSLVMPFVADAFNNAIKCDQKVETIQKSIEATKLKLVGALSPEELLAHLQFSDIESAFTVSKALAFTVKVSLLSDVIIFDTVSAVIDGTIKVNFSQNEKDIGTALMSFPTYGIGLSIKSVILKGICLSEEFDISAPITVKYEPYHLWAMEK